MTAKHSRAFLLGLAAFFLAACDGVAPPASPPELKFRADVQGATLPQPGSGGASGSGCVPATAPLPDGVWFGFIMAWNAEGVEFDPACWYAGEAAFAKAAERGRIRRRMPSISSTTTRRRGASRCRPAPTRAGFRRPTNSPTTTACAKTPATARSAPASRSGSSSTAARPPASGRKSRREGESKCRQLQLIAGTYTYL